MDGQLLRYLLSEDLTKLIGKRWRSTGILAEPGGGWNFVEETVQPPKDGIELITDVDTTLSNLLSYPLYATLARIWHTLAKQKRTVCYG